MASEKRPGLRFLAVLEGWRNRPDLYTVAYIMPFLEAMVQANVVYLKTHPETPPLHLSGVRYKRETEGEVWKDIPAILRDGFDDCEGLACWYAAELRVLHGLPARPVISAIDKPEGGRLFHIRVAVGSKRFDPSKDLGMKGEA